MVSGNDATVGASFPHDVRGVFAYLRANLHRAVPMTGYGAERKHVISPTNFRLFPRNPSFAQMRLDGKVCP
jgi:hypothetical protein